jgi:carbonic anhydrase/acetyltransferase-like protein (isoleucine patch superfamily)
MRNIRQFENFIPDINHNAYIDESAVIIGNVTIGSQSSIWPMSVLRGDVNSIIIGQQTNIQDGSILHVSHAGKFSDGAALSIGNRVTVGHRVILHACKVCDLTLIGMGSIVRDNAVIESEVILGAGSLVPEGKRLTSGHLYLGSPAKQVRKLINRDLQYLDYSARHYVQLMQRHRPV